MDGEGGMRSHAWFSRRALYSSVMAYLHWGLRAAFEVQLGTSIDNEWESLKRFEVCEHQLWSASALDVEVSGEV